MSRLIGNNEFFETQRGAKTAEARMTPIKRQHTAADTLAPGARISLTQVAQGGPPHPAETLLNGPVYARDTFHVACQSVKAGFFLALGLDAQYMDTEVLEDMDLFFDDPGWRVFGTAQELKAVFENAGYSVTLTTSADLRLASERAAAREQEERLQFERDRAANDRLRDDIRALASADGRISAGYSWEPSVCDHNGAIRDVTNNILFQREDALGTYVGYASQPGVLYKATSTVTGLPCYIHCFGNASVLWADPATVNESFSRKWAPSVGTADPLWLFTLAVDHISSREFYNQCSGHEYRAWVWDRHGKELREWLTWGRIELEPRLSCGIDVAKALVLNEKYGLPYRVLNDDEPRDTGHRQHRYLLRDSKRSTDPQCIN